MPDALAASEVTIAFIADLSLYLLRLPRRPTITTFFTCAEGGHRGGF